MKKYFIFLLITGFFTFSAFSQSADILLNGTVSAENNQIKNVLNPTDSGDAVNLDYLNERLDFYQNQIDNLQSLLDNLQLKFLKQHQIYLNLKIIQKKN